MTNSWIYRGRAWIFGDDLGIDGDIMPLRFALARETDPEVLRHHLMSGIDKDFAARVKPGDLIVAGKRFGQGNPHIQGLLGIRGAALGLLAESIPSGTYRNAINAGLHFLPECRDIRSSIKQGDELTVDFSTGQVHNRTRGLWLDFEPLPKALRQIVEIGGWREHFRARLGERQLRAG